MRSELKVTFREGDLWENPEQNSLARYWKMTMIGFQQLYGWLVSWFQKIVQTLFKRMRDILIFLHNYEGENRTNAINHQYKSQPISKQYPITS
jgi:hypothetical protein